MYFVSRTKSTNYYLYTAFNSAEQSTHMSAHDSTIRSAKWTTNDGANYAADAKTFKSA